jgi:hypothetical protein
MVKGIADEGDEIARQQWFCPRAERLSIGI